MGLIEGRVRVGVDQRVRRDTARRRSSPTCMSGGVVGRRRAAWSIFLPQICLLFFLLSLLEDTGYPGARRVRDGPAACGRFGLPGHSFVPLLSQPRVRASRASWRARLIPDPPRAARHDPGRALHELLRPHPGLCAADFRCSSPIGPSWPAWRSSGCYRAGHLSQRSLSALIARRTLHQGQALATDGRSSCPCYRLPVAAHRAA
jgi:hypothetical protein